VSETRILVVRGGAIGDFLMTLPALAALRERWPEAHLEILGYPHITELARGRYYANATRSIEAKPLAGFFVPGGWLDPGLVKYFESFELVVSYLYDPDQVFAENLRRSDVRHLVQGSPRPTDRHAAEHYCAPLESLAVYVPAPRPRVFPSEADRLFAAEYLGAAAAKPWAAIHPGSGSGSKNWPATKFATLARWLTGERGFGLLVIGGEADEQPLRVLTGQLADWPHRVVHGLQLVELAAVLERCALFVGNDSGITHLAAAVQTPTVALFGPASRPIWEPRGERVHVVQFGATDVAAVQQTVDGWRADPPG